MKNKDKNDSNANVAQYFELDLIDSSFVCYSDECMVNFLLVPIIFVPIGNGLSFTDLNSWKVVLSPRTKLKLHDATIRFLTKVQYLPDMKKNIILVDLLESKALNIVMENGTIQSNIRCIIGDVLYKLK